MSASVTRASGKCARRRPRCPGTESADTPGEQPAQRDEQRATKPHRRQDAGSSANGLRLSVARSARRRDQQATRPCRASPKHQVAGRRRYAPRAAQPWRPTRYSSRKRHQELHRREQPDPVAQRRAIGAQRQRDQPDAAAEQRRLPQVVDQRARSFALVLARMVARGVRAAASARPRCPRARSCPSPPGAP